jgi:hypothetical protein
VNGLESAGDFFSSGVPRKAYHLLQAALSLDSRYQTNHTPHKVNDDK